MPVSENPQNGAAVITDKLVATLGAIAGLNFPAERLPLIAQRLRELHIVASDLDAVALGATEPSIRFDPTWSNGGAA